MSDSPGVTLLTGDRRLDDEALAELYRPPDREWLRVNLVTSTDGAVEVAGHSTGLSSPPDQRLLTLLRAGCDALLLGAGTLRVEGYAPSLLPAGWREWRRGRGLPDHPALVIVSDRLAVDPASPVFTRARARPVVLTRTAAPADRRAALARVADVVTAGDDRVDLDAGLALLRRRGLRQVLCEGGPYLFGSLTAGDLVDELCLTVAPLLAGPGAGRITAGAPVAAAHRLALRHVLVADDSVFLRYVRPDTADRGPTR